MSQLYIVTLIPQLTRVVHLVTCQTGWFTCWNQDRWEKHKKTQLFRWYHSNGRKWKGIKNLYTRVKEESKRAGSKLNIKKSKIMDSCPITPRQKNWEKVETVTDIISVGSKITTVNDYSHEIKRHLLLERKAVTTLTAYKKAETSLCGQRSI